MFCISSVGGNVPHLVNIARSGRPILALDGCVLAGTLHCLAERGLSAHYHLQLQARKLRSQFAVGQPNPTESRQ